ncbi:MAG TPA: NmrA family NAD(P)-binding protein, partial [Bryobacteraceae bacterium]|nr:NmrA family NAD(P)-binding protein [Bryobacteraceae bacterium]
MYVVTGAGGQTGRATVEALLAKKQPVTAILRSDKNTGEWTSKGVEIVHADVMDVDAMSRLLRGKAGAYLMIPPNYGAADYIEDRRQVTKAYAQIIERSGIEHVVFLSSFGSQHDHGTGPIVTTHNGEADLRPVARNITFLRASSFLENVRSVVPIIKERGIFPTFFTPGRPVPQIATEDVGRFAAEMLVNPARGKRIEEITGPEDYTPEQLAQAASDVLGKPVPVQAAPPSAAIPVMTADGLPERTAKLMAEM